VWRFCPFVELLAAKLSSLFFFLILRASLSSSFEFQPYCPVIKSTLRKVINGPLHAGVSQTVDQILAKFDCY
jgi:hypothetical protein